MLKTIVLLNNRKKCMSFINKEYDKSGHLNKAVPDGAKTLQGINQISLCDYVSQPSDMNYW